MKITLTRMTRLRVAVIPLAMLALTSSAIAQRVPGQAAWGGDPQGFQVHYTANFSADELVFGSFHGFDTVSLPDAYSTGAFGEPRLPAVPVRIALPAEMTATGVRVLSSTPTALAREYNLLPNQPPRRLGEAFADEDFIAPDPTAYASFEAVPAMLAEFSYQTDLAGQSMAVIRVFPLQYVAAEQKLILHTDIDIVIDGVGGYVCGDYLPERLSTTGRAAVQATVESMVVNPLAVQLRSLTGAPRTIGVSPGDYEYVIITKADWVDELQPLADWKTKKGMLATIVTTDWIYNSGGYSGTNQDKIQEFFQDAYSSWGAMYFLLGADTDNVPCHTRYIGGDNVPNDTYYADFDNDWTCEVYVGRAPLRTAAGITRFVNQALTYQKNPPLTDYAKKIGQFGFDLDASTQGEECTEYVSTQYVPAGWDETKVYDSYGGVHETYVKAAINEGQNLINHVDHCDHDYIGVGITNHNLYLTKAEVDAFYNGDRQSIMYSIGCWANAYDYTDCVAEHFIRDADGGGVGFVGNSRYGWYSAGSSSTLSMKFDRFFFRSLFYDGFYRLGHCFTDHKNDGVSGDTTERYIYTELTLLGEPELPIWTDDPQTLTVTHDPTLTEGQYTAFPVQVYDGGSPLQYATVCLWKDGDVYEVQLTNYSGMATFWFSPSSTGTMYVTVTAQNFLPYEDQAEVVSGAAHTLTISSTPVNGVSIQVAPLDNNSNGDGTTEFARVYDSGENVTLTAPQRPTVSGDELTLCNWEIGGVDQTDGETVLLHTVGGEVNLVAEYLKVGDMTGDGAVNGFDIDLFIEALDNQAAFEATYGPCRLRAADTNGDGEVNGFDIDGFIALLG
ncbi:MAG: hypothetical protein KKB50_11305 [Planctomycetes bacterium]|nr:hypothetical protein [Planctomycetota bacterium]